MADEEEYDLEEEEEELEEELEEEDEEEMESKIKELEAELTHLNKDGGEGKEAAPAEPAPNVGKEDLISDLLRNPLLDGTGIVTGESVDALKRTIYSLQNQLDAMTNAHRSDLSAFRRREEELQTRIRGLEDLNRTNRDHIIDLEAKAEDGMTKLAVMENQRNKYESEARELHRQVSVKDQQLHGNDEVKRQLEARIFRLEQDNHALEAEIQNLNWRIKALDQRLEQESKDKAEQERLVHKFQTENQDLGLRILSATGTSRVQQAEIDTLHRDIKLANAEREESIKVAVAKTQVEQEMLSLREELLEASRQLTLTSNSLNQYKDECNRLNEEFAKAQRQAELWRKELLNQEDLAGGLGEEVKQLKALSEQYEGDIDRLNSLLIEERKSGYSKFVTVPDGSGTTRVIGGAIGAMAATDTVKERELFLPGAREASKTPPGGPSASSTARGGATDFLSTRGRTGALEGLRQKPEYNYTDGQPSSAGGWRTFYGSEYLPKSKEVRQIDEKRAAGGSSPFISRARSNSPTTHPTGKEEHLGPYGRVYEIADNLMDRNLSKHGLNLAKGGVKMSAADQEKMEARMMELNKERTQIEAILMKYPSNSAGKTLHDRKNKQQAEVRLVTVEKELSEIRGVLRAHRNLVV
ncbi:unnamed protein product [Amoebophrya sp. A25]|nr:unnamed protein product [Amoebophrya sp. A25]|eukprot:GSA25T00021200001.1